MDTFISKNQVAGSAIMSLLSPLQQAHIRGAGTAGHRLFVVAVEVQTIPVYARRVDQSECCEDITTSDRTTTKKANNALDGGDEVYESFPMGQSTLANQDTTTPQYISDAEALLESYEVVVNIPIAVSRDHPTVSSGGRMAQYALSPMHSTPKMHVVAPSCCHRFTIEGTHPQCGGMSPKIVDSRVRHLDLGDTSELQTASFCDGWRLLRSVSMNPSTIIVTSIGGLFMNGCSSLEYFDTTPLQHVTTISSKFFFNCTNLRELDLSNFTKLKSVGQSFLGNCKMLKTLNFGGFGEVTTLGYGFLGGCESLEEIDLSPMAKVQSIAEGFLRGCKLLKIADMSGMVALQRVGWNFASNCSSMTQVTLPPNLPRDRCPFSTWMFMEGTNITSIHLSPFFNGNAPLPPHLSDSARLDLVTSVGDLFLSSCKNIVEIDLSCFSNVAQIGAGFMQYCTALKAINLKMPLLVSVGDDFGRGCTALETFSAGRTEPWMSIGTGFLGDCKSLKISNSVETDFAVLGSPCAIGMGLFLRTKIQSLAANAGITPNKKAVECIQNCEDTPTMKSRKCTLL